MMERFLPDEAATIALAEELAPLLKTGDCLALSGDLGMGKSTFARALIRARLGEPALDVPSPTFTLLQLYDGTPALYHFDLYRLSDPDELIELGFDEALEEGISLIEWPERGEGMLPEETLTLSFDEEGNGRRVRLSGPDARCAELAGAFG
ncbi:hypothetical protein GGR30_000872 [Martelella radicis]|uniref:tRNA threonylcarbamoyladenosine biosynthesis protein TsaE n=1 Tax=Martelella radicis TaxID=1397476 RepID=A0A7W6KGS8_9HYPH|nr:tRNA (adenosine(37)-N6)-threonylcarbamoyltransferase complex ATPase subunit type 1 TsaE [Martelella radicis]MBB4120961.1 hypothetical protein [Martelella radicis]